MARYCFRIKFRLQQKIKIDDRRIVLHDEPPIRVALVPAKQDVDLADEPVWTVIGEGFASFEDADAAAHRWDHAMRVGLIESRHPANFGDRDPLPATRTADAVKEHLRIEHGITLIDDEQFLVFPCTSPVQVTSAEVSLDVLRQPGDLVARVRAAAERGGPLSEPRVIAFGLWSASWEMRNKDASFLLLMMAVETLISQGLRSRATTAYVEELIAMTRTREDLDRSDRDALVGGLVDQKRESVGQAGRRLARSLEPQEYMGMAPDGFFVHCYRVRSEMVHGAVPRPPTSDVDPLLAPLREFVADLLQRGSDTPAGPGEQ